MEDAITQQLKQEKSFILQTGALGELYSFTLTHGNHKAIRERLGKDMSMASPEEFARVLISVTCHPKDKLVDGKFRPTDYTFSMDDVAKINPDELETFASLYLESNEYLYRKTIDNMRPAENGKGTIISLEYGEIEYPRTENESSLSYLHRVWPLYEAKIAKRLQDAVQPALKAYKALSDTFSRFSEEQIDKTLKMGAALKDSLRDVPRVKPVSVERVMQPLPNLAELFRKEEEARLRPFEELANRLDELIELSANTTEFIVQLNKTQTMVAGELKKSGNTTLRYSEWNLGLTIVIIVLTCISIAVGAFSIYHSIETTEQITKQLESIDSHATSSSTNVQNQTNKLIELQTAMVDELRKIRQQNSSQKKSPN